jgi:hypothetical protein
MCSSLIGQIKLIVRAKKGKYIVGRHSNTKINGRYSFSDDGLIWY